AAPTLISDTAAGNSMSPSVSKDGKYTVFTNSAANLVPNEVKADGSTFEVFLLNRDTNQATLVSHDSGNANQTSNGSNFNPVISADGNWIAWSSTASDLVANQTAPGTGLLGASTAVYLYNVQSGTTQAVSHTPGSATTLADNSSGSEIFAPSISADGKFVTYTSNADNLVSGFTAGGSGLTPVSNAYVYNRSTDTNTLVSAQSGST